MTLVGPVMVPEPSLVDFLFPLLVLRFIQKRMLQVEFQSRILRGTRKTLALCLIDSVSVSRSHFCRREKAKLSWFKASHSPPAGVSSGFYREPLHQGRQELVLLAIAPPSHPLSSKAQPPVCLSGTPSQGALRPQCGGLSGYDVLRCPGTGLLLPTTHWRHTGM